MKGINLTGQTKEEVDTLAELKEMRQKVMELETQNHVCTNQLKRQDDEMKRVREDMETVSNTNKEMDESLRSEKQKFIQKESELREECMNERLKYSEAMQNIQDLRDKITQMEIKKAEKWTQNQLRGSYVCDLDEDSIYLVSLCSNGDALSVASKYLIVLICDMTVKVPTLNDPNKVESEYGPHTDYFVSLAVYLFLLLLHVRLFQLITPWSPDPAADVPVQFNKKIQ